MENGTRATTPEQETCRDLVERPNIKEDHQIIGLISQLLIAAGLAPMASLGDRMVDDLIEDASKGKPFDFPAMRAQ